MKSKVLNTVIVLFLVAGVCVFLYPTIGDLVNRVTSKAAISGYEEAVENMDSREKEEKLSIAEDYNRRLTDGSVLSDPEKGIDDFVDSFSVSKIIGYISIPQIEIYLPIYTGEAAEVLSKGVWLVPHTSLPVGGKSTHAVLSGHRGLPSAKLFTNLDKLEIGDMFYINVLGEELAYRIDQIKTVLPQEVDDIHIVRDKDYITLVTCTPYGINTHRLLIRGEREEFSPEVRSNLPKRADSVLIVPGFDVFIAASFIIALAITVVIIKRKKKKRRLREMLNGIKNEAQKSDGERYFR